MNRASDRIFDVILTIVMGAVLALAPVAHAAEKEGPPRGHKKATGVVVKKAGALAVKTPDGAIYQVNPLPALRHGHAAHKEGDEVSVLLDENNAVIDMHPKGDEGKHRFVTGKLVYVGKMKKEIKLQTPEGEKVFPIERLEIKTGGIEEGSTVTAELNEAGTLIDLHRGDGTGDKH
jgi:hypothetical protein